MILPNYLYLAHHQESLQFQTQIMRQRSHFAITWVFLLLVQFAFGAGDHTDGKEAHSFKHDSKEHKVMNTLSELDEEAKQIIEHEDNIPAADSVYHHAISIAENTFNDRITLLAYIQYLRNTDLAHPRGEMIKILYKVSDILNTVNDFDLIFAANEAITAMWVDKSDPENSLTYAMKLLSQASTTNSYEKKISAFLLTGKALEINNQKQDAFENYLLAREQISQLPDEKKAKHSYELDGNLFDFYFKINQFEKAAEHKIKQINYITSGHMDSTILMRLQLDLNVMRLAQNNLANVKEDLEEVISYGERHHKLRLRNLGLSFYRSLLLNTQDLDGFHELFVERYPDELQNIKNEFIAQYYIISAYLQEGSGSIDSARSFFIAAEEEVQEFDNDIYSSNFYRRYGEFLYRNGAQEEAMKKFEMSFDKAESQDYLKYMLESSALLEKAALEMNDYQLAYRYSNIHDDLDKRNSRALHADNMLRMELKSQARQMEYIAEKKDLEKKKKYSIQYTIIIISIAVLFMILIVVSSFRVPEWLIEMLGFITILFLFEFILLILAKQIYRITHGEPLQVFLIKVSILMFLFPLHHIIEHWVTQYMKEHQMIGKITRDSMSRPLQVIWPWFKKRHDYKEKEDIERSSKRSADTANTH